MWKVLKYKSLPPNKIEFNNQKLVLNINKSASPLIFPFEKPQKITNIKLDIDIVGTLNLKAEEQGSEGNDDFKFRLGVVYTGDKTLSSFQLLFVPEWISTLYSLAPEGKGIDHIHFFNSWQDSRIKGKTRTHYASELIKESFVLNIQNQKISDLIELDGQKEIAALWISSDGDDTNSEFKVIVNKITVN